MAPILSCIWNKDPPASEAPVARDATGRGFAYRLDRTRYDGCQQYLELRNSTDV